MGRDTDVRNKLTARGNHSRDGHDILVHAVMSLRQNKSHSRLISMQERKYIEGFVKFSHLGFGTKFSLCTPNTSTARAISTQDSFNFQKRTQFGQYCVMLRTVNRVVLFRFPMWERNVSSPKDTDHPSSPPMLLFDGYRQRLPGGKATEA